VAQIFFHCANDDGVWIDRRLMTSRNLTDAVEQATSVVRSLVMSSSGEDWRGWTLYASDDIGSEVFAMPFATVLGPAH